MTRHSRFLPIVKGLLIISMVSISGKVKPQSEGFTIDARAGLINSNIVKAGNTVGSALTNPFGGFQLTTPALFAKDTQRSIRNFRLSLGTRYQVIGATFNDPRYKHKFHYLSLPLKASIQLFPGLEANAGVSHGFLISNFRTENNANEEDLPIQSPSSTHIWGLAGFDMALSENLGLQLSYQHSLEQLPAGHRFRGFRLGLNYQLNGHDPAYESGSQMDRKRQNAQKHLNRLKRGILLVRLPSNRKQIKHLRAERDSLNKKENLDAYLSVRKQLETLKNETERRHQKLIKAFKKSFDFCDYAFFYDYQTDTILTKNWPLIAFKQTGEKGLSVKPDQPRYILDVGRSYLKRQHQSYEGMVIRDTSLRALKEPFPAKLPNSQTFKFLELQKDANEMVRKLNHKLKTFSR